MDAIPTSPCIRRCSHDVGWEVARMCSGCKMGHVIRTEGEFLGGWREAGSIYEPSGSTLIYIRGG